MSEPVPAQAPGEPETGWRQTRPQGLFSSVSNRRRRTVLVTAAVCGAVATIGHVLLWVAYSTGWNDEPPYPVPWQAVSAIVLSIVATVAFGGLFSATNRLRIAIAGAFLLTFLVMTTFALSINAFDQLTSEDNETLKAFRDVVKTVVGFYFGAEAVVSGVKAYGTSQPGADAAQVRRSDRDLPGDVD